ncbi:hypothetical protein DYH09_19635 [bacterium CPR1]|nr:hypothetical protein [bacterium CPR1]
MRAIRLARGRSCATDQCRARWRFLRDDNGEEEGVKIFDLVLRSQERGLERFQCAFEKCLAGPSP